MHRPCEFQSIVNVASCCRQFLLLATRPCCTFILSLRNARLLSCYSKLIQRRGNLWKRKFYLWRMMPLFIAAFRYISFPNIVICDVHCGNASLNILETQLLCPWCFFFFFFFFGIPKGKLCQLNFIYLYFVKHNWRMNSLKMDMLDYFIIFIALSYLQSGKVAQKFWPFFICFYDQFNIFACVILSTYFSSSCWILVLKDSRFYFAVLGDPFSWVECYFQVNNLICIEKFSDFPQLGRFTLRTEGANITHFMDTFILPSCAV